ncbi:MAG: 3'-5' exonuclease domain-containing protein 2 [Bacteroidales bacterium]|nr:3'-5' exonuclease domain-containing protein 2 [Bacteroidales bacterium]
MFKISVTNEEADRLPLCSFPGEIHIITRPGRDLNRAAAYLASQKMIGFDTETRPVFSPAQKHNNVALLQLSGEDHAFLFRIFKLGMPKCLTKIMSDPSILKIGAAVHDDVRGLQHYANFAERGYIDLQNIAWEWGIKDKSVKKLAANILGLKVSKAQQLSNWEADNLSPAQQMYSATDAWVCLEMYKKLLVAEKNPLTARTLSTLNCEQSNG